MPSGASATSLARPNSWRSSTCATTFVAVHGVAVDDARELREAAARAHLERELGRRLGLRELVPAQVRIGERRRAEVEETDEVAAAADATVVVDLRSDVDQTFGRHSDG